jgi:hypothetical protein
MNLVASVPPMVSPVTVSEALPVFDSDTVLLADVVPTRVSPNASVVGVTVSIGARPVPDNATSCVGIAGSFDVRVTFPDRVPAAPAVNVSTMFMLLPAAIVTGSVVVVPKSAEFVPVNPRPEMVSVPSPVLLTERLEVTLVPTGCDPKASELAADSTGATAVPLRLTTTWGLLTRSVPTVIVALREPRAVGVNWTLSGSDVPPARGEGSTTFGMWKSPGFTPATEIDVMLNDVEPVLAMVSVWGELWPTVTDPNVSGEGVTDSGLTPVPLSDSDCAPLALLVKVTDPLAAPVVVGPKETPKVVVADGASEMGNVSPLSANGPVTLAAVTVSVSVPGLLIVTVVGADCPVVA